MIQEFFGRENPNDEEMKSLDEAEDVVTLKLQCTNEFKIYLDVAKLYVKDTNPKLNVHTSSGSTTKVHLSS